MVYTSIDNPRIKDCKKLQSKKYRDEKNLFFVEGEHLVLEAYKAGCLETLILKEGLSYPLNVECIYVTDNILKYLSEMDTYPQVMGVCRKVSERGIAGNVIVLDEVQDPGNLGTIIRSSVAFNIDSIIVSAHTVDVYNPKVVRASQGLIFYTNILVRDLTEEINKLKQDNYYIIGTKVTGGKKVETIEKKYKFAIIVGNEGSGMSKYLDDLCDTFAYIDMNEKCESLNVGVAASILLYELDK